MKSLNHKSCLVSFKGTISPPLDFEHSFASNHILLRGRKNKLPGLICKESGMLFVHGVNPMRMILYLIVGCGLGINIGFS
jgi:hypothetical protein